MSDKIAKTDAQWREQLTVVQYQVTRQGHTEAPFSEQNGDQHQSGTYVCVCCGTSLFDTEAKFDSGSGWPSF